MQLEYKNTDGFIRRILPFYFSLIFITTIAGSVLGGITHNPWTIGDWLINYQGGMVRRGFFGETIFQISIFTEINPVIYIVITQVFLYAIFLFFSYKLIIDKESLLPYSFLIFSPFIFNFQINDINGGFRKEILFIAILSFIVWVAKVKKQKEFERIFYLTLTLYPLVILSHELLAVYLPYLFAVYFLSFKIDSAKIKLLALLTIPSLIACFLSIYFSGSEKHVVSIFNSIEKFGCPVTPGAITWLNKNMADGFTLVKNQILYSHYIFYIFILIISLMAYIPIIENIKKLIKNKYSLLLISSSIFGTIVLGVVAADWGRFIYIHLVALFLLLLLPAVEGEKVPFKRNRLINKSTLIAFLFYITFWHIPHYGSPLDKWKLTNVFSFAKPYSKLASFYFPAVNSSAENQNKQ